MNWIFIFVIAIAAFVWLFVRRKSPPKLANGGHAKPVLEKNDFHGISISMNDSACMAVKKLQNKRFLANQAPDLPLTDCNAASCSCHYIHHEDRRKENDDRRAAFSLRTDLYGSTQEENDRRAARDRRKS